MLAKLLKNDLKRNMRWMWILFVVTIIFAGLTRGCAELGKNLMLFQVVGIIFDSVFYTLVANCIIHPFLRSFLNFTKSVYGDESYLTHTLPVTKNQIFNSKFLTAVIEILLGFLVIVASILIRFGSPEMFLMLELLLSTLIVGEISVFGVLSLIITLVVVEFLMFISIILFSIILAYRGKEKKALKSFLLTGLFSLIALTVLSVVLVVVMLINGVDIASSSIVLTNSAFYGIIISGIVVYLMAVITFYLLAKNALRKGVNVD